MRCAICKRALFTVAVMIGVEAVGPKCAKKLGLSPKKSKRITVVRLGKIAKDDRDNRTMDLFGETQ